MKPIKGLNKDVNPVSVPTGGHIDGRNMVIDKNQSISNEKGFDLMDIISSTYNGKTAVVCGIIETPFGIAIVFSYYEDADTFKVIEIGKFDGTSYTRILRDGGTTAPTFDWDLACPITGTTRKNYKGEILVTWRDSNNPGGLLNIDTLPFTLGVNDLINTTPIDKRNLLALFPDQILPNIELKEVVEGGGVLESGTYFFTSRYELEDGTATSWGTISNPVMVIADNLSQTNTISIQGDEGGVITGKSILLDLSNVDTRYTHIRLGVIEKVQRVLSAYSTILIPIEGKTTLTIPYSGTEQKDTVELTEFTIDNISYDRIGSITELESRLHIGGLERTFEVDYQPFANNITASWVYEDDVSLNGSKGSYRDPNMIFFKRGYQADEVYAFYIVPIYKDGTFAEACHIPGRDIFLGSNPGGQNYNGKETKKISDPTLLASDNAFGGDLTNKDQYLEIDPDAKYFQLINSSTGPGTGRQMSYWENENEFYPNDVARWGTLAGKNVRHHKLPSLEQIHFIEGGTITAIDAVQNGVSDGAFLRSVLSDNFQDLEATIHVFPLSKFSNSYGNSILNTSANYDDDVAPALNPGLAFNNGTNNVPVGYNPWLPSPSSPQSISPFTAQNGFTFTKGGKLYINLSASFYVSDGGTYTVNYRLYHNNNKISEKKDIRANSIDNLVDEADLGANDDGRWYGVTVDDQMILDIEVGDILYFHFYTEGQPEIDVNFKNSLPTVRQFTFSLGINEGETGDVTGTQFTKVLGVKFDNIEFPPSIADKIQGYQICYAKRDFYNSTIVSQSYFEGSPFRTAGLNRGGGQMRKIRYHAFDSLLNKYPTIGTYMKINFGIDDTTDVNTDPDAYKISDKDSSVRKITRLEYAPEDNSAFKFPGEDGSESNKNKEERLHIELVEDNLSGFNTFQGSLSVYRKDVYLDFSNQPLVSTGKTYHISGTGIYSTGTVYGGDIFRVLQGINITNNLYNTVRLDEDDEDQGQGKSFYTFAESKDNVHYRYDDLTDPDNPKSYYPKRNDSNVYLYNKDFSSLNDLNPVFPKSLAESVTSFPYRIARGVLTGLEDSTLNWRLFRPLDYYEMRKDRGELTNLESYGKQLIIHMSDGLFRTITQDRFKGGVVEVNLGTGDIFAREPDEILPNDSGYAGTESQVSAIVTKMGYVFIDEKRGKVFILSSQLQELSIIGLRDFFRDDLEKVLPVGFKEDSPFNNAGFTIAMDEHNNRLLLTKRNDASESFTLSYSIELQKWAFFHDYTPEMMFSLDNKLYSYGEQGFYKHNSDSNRGTYYNGTSYESYIDIVFSEPNTMNKLFYALKWVSEVKGDNGAYFHNDTVTKAFVYNSYQASKEIPLERLRNMRKEDSHWSFNDFRDLVTDDTRNNRVPFMDDDNKVIPSTIYSSTSSFKKRRFIDNYLVVRLYFDNLDNKALFLYDVEATWRLGQRSS